MSEHKLFTLMNASEVRVAAGTKVLSAEDYSTAANANEVLETVQADALQYKKDVANQCEQEKEAAQREGFAIGMQQWAEQIALLQQEAERVQERMTKLIVPLAIKAAKKIVGRESKLDEGTLVDIVATTLRSVSDHKEIALYVNIREFELLDQNKEKLRSVFDKLDSLSIQSRDDIPLGGYVIETEAGIINADLENQWAQLEAAMQAIMEKQQAQEE